MLGLLLHRRSGWLLLVLIIAIVWLNACSNSSARSRVAQVYSPPQSETVEIDLKHILERGYLTMLTENTSTSYYIYKGQPIGYDYELIRSFCDHLGVDLRVHIMDDLNEMFELLNSGEGDIIACNLAITKDRREWVSFTEPLMQTHQVLIQNKKNELIKNAIHLKGKDVFVHPFSAFYSRLQNLEDEIGGEINIHPVNGAIDSEKLIQLVAQGDIDLTVADNNLAQLNRTYFHELDIDTKISFDQDVAWAVRKPSISLHRALNDWLDQKSVINLKAYTYRKYYKLTKSQKNRVQSLYSSLYGKRISIYDDKIKLESEKIGWDWKLLAALIYQESRFDPHAKSWVGAFGLMQLMPGTASQFGIDSMASEHQNIEAGVKYIKYLEKMWASRIANKKERTKFILASYNVGPGHVFDAQKLAQFLGKDPDLWEDNVADCLLLKSDPNYYNLDLLKYGYCRGSEPFAYVRDIMQHYQHYSAID